MVSYPASAKVARHSIFVCQSPDLTGLESINEDDGDKGKDYGANTLSSFAKRLDAN